MSAAPTEVSPLSPVQRARLSWCAADPERAVARVRLEASGALDRERLARAFGRLRERHELLAMRVVRVPEIEQPVQVVGEAPDGDAAVARIEVETIPGTDRAHVEITLPWLLVDGTTLRALASELVEAYGRDEASGPDALQFLDVAAWQEDLLESDEAEDARRFWSNVAPEAPRPLFPYERDVTPASAVSSVTLLRSLDGGPAEALAKWGASHGVSVEDGLRAGFSALLLRRSGAAVPLALRIEGRDAPELEGAAGPLDRWVPLPGEADADPGAERFSEHARRLAAAAEVRRWADAFDGKGRHGADLGPFPAAFGAGAPVAGVASDPVEAGGVGFALESVECGPLPAPLVLEAEIAPAVATPIALRWTAMAGSAEAEALASLADDFEALLGSVLAEDPVLDAVALAANRGLAMLETRAVATAPSVVEGVSARVEEDASALAVTDGQVTLSRGELDRRAADVASALRRAGIGVGARVGVALPRSAAVVGAFLGSWRVGAAFVPLDLDLPPRAIADRIEAGALDAVLVPADSGSSLTLPPGVLRVELELSRRDAVIDAPDAPVVPGPTDLAYGIFTSGSTGRPKLVGVEHGALASYVAGVSSRIGFEAGWSFASVSSFASDLGHTAIFPALAAGGTLHVIDAACAMDADRLAERFRASPVDVLKIVPSHLAALLSGRNPEGVLPRRVLVLGGERLDPALVERIRALAPALRIVNHYGPTESTVGVLTHEVDASTAPPLGVPLPGVCVEVVDGAGRVVPRGVPGELWIGGAQLARGYVGRDDLTRERFVDVERPGSEVAGRRYRTGDRAWIDAEGRVHFGGRVDDQLKIRGLRIEPGEIERVLGEHPEVRGAAVRAFGERLVGYSVGGADPDALGHWLAERLPAAMVPERIVPLERLPLNANGKLDRRALPEPKAAAAGPYVAPEGEDEVRLASIFAAVLGVERVSATASFFEQGGHSLLATRAVSRIREAFQVELPLSALFEEPTVRGLAPRVAATTEAVLPPLEQASREGPLPLSFAQRRMWLLDRLEPEGRAAYAIPMAARLRGALDVVALSASVEALVRRHESLRTVFEVGDDGEPVQRIQPESAAARVPVERVDLRDVPDAEREAAVLRALSTRSLAPFDLAEGPLLRVAVLELGDDDAVLLAVCHHVVFDAWSRGVLLAELTALYGAFARGAESPLAPLDVQYADFAAWQRGWLAGDRLEAERDHWRRTLAGAPGLLELPTDRSRPTRPTHRGDRVAVRVEAGTSDAVRTLATREGATPFMVLLAVFDVWLARLAGRDDIVVGSPIANRRRPELEPLIGFFSNTIVLRTDLSGNPSFRELVGRVRRTALEAYAHQDLPFEELVEGLPVERNLSANPLFQVLFTLRNTPRDPVVLDGLTFEPVGADVPTSKFDLTMLLEETEHGILGNLEFATDLFDRETIEGWRDAYVALLEAAVASPDTGLADLPTGLPASLLPGLEAPVTAEAPAPSATLAECFASVARECPESPAVGADGSWLRYADLERRSNQLARTLLAAGVQPEERVGLAARRGPDEWVAMLAVWKVGAAYVPLDPGFPAERLAWMVESSQVRFALTDGAEAAGALPEGLRTIPLDDAGTFSPSADPLEAPFADPEGLAYVLYTSGSTGRPKGVGVPHRAARFFLEAMTSRLGWSADTRMLAVTTLGFDIALLERWGPLLVGGCSEVASLETAADGVALAKRIAEAKPTALQGTPATWRLLQDASWDGDAGLQALVGGEALPFELADWIAGRSREVWNLYGPTETTVWSTAHRFDPERSAEAGSTVGLGTPLGATRLAVIDAHGAAVPVGVWGELAIGGPGVARGYEGRGAETACRFVPDPFGAAPGARMYRTGDVCRLRRDGALEYGGRRDGQVKLRGYRIEVGDIEAQLLAQDSVRACAVVIAEGALVAFIVAAGDELDADGLRRALSSALPPYMVPQRIAPIAELPLTPNGKIDRRALVDAADSLEGDVREHVEPRTETESVVASVFAGVLGLDRVSAEAGFFDLGGHSLLATRVAVRIREELGVEVPLRALFEAPTVAALAERIDAGVTLGEGTSVSSAPIRVGERPASIPLSYAQERLWFLDQLAPGDASYGIPFALRLEGALDSEALRRAVQGVVERHEVLRTTFPAVEGRPEQRIHAPDSEVARAAARVVDGDLSACAAAEQDAALRERLFAFARESFDLAAGPLMRTLLVRLSPDAHVVALVTHHIVSDGWSAGVLARELTTLYANHVAGTPSALPALDVQYADWALHEREVLDEATLAAELDHWRRTLAGVPQQLLRPDRDEPPRPAEASFRLDGADVERLESLAREHDASLFMVCLAAFQLLLGREGSTDDVVVGTDVAHRTHGATEKLIGFFVNVLALRTRLDGSPSFGELVDRVRETCLEAYAHQDVPFARVAGEIGERRDDGRSPLIQVLFVFQNLPSVRVQLGGLQAEVVEPAEPTTKFDVAFFFRRTETGLAGTWRYDAGRFSAARIEGLARRFEQLLASVGEAPEVGIDEIDVRTEAEREAERERTTRRAQGRRSRLRRAAAKPVAAATQSPVRAGAEIQGLVARDDNGSAPFCVEAIGDDADLVGWARAESATLVDALARHGAVLFRGGPFHEEGAFEALGRALTGELYGEYGDLPRSSVGGRVYGSTPYPADRSILFHSESSHLTTWPTRILFGCVVPAETRGETPLADGRVVLERLPDAVRQRFETRGLRYSRTFTEGLDVRWQDFFRTNSREEVERRCAETGTEIEWDADGTLRISDRRPAVGPHPDHGFPVWFNQICLHHPRYLDAGVREALLGKYGAERLPRNVTFGDGETIEENDLACVDRAYEDARVEFAWRRGDVLLVDNERVAHARNPFTGERRIIVAMGRMRTPEGITDAAGGAR